VGEISPTANDPEVAASMGATLLWSTGIDPKLLLVLGLAGLLVVALV
jgi:hypothetical protein